MLYSTDFWEILKILNMLHYAPMEIGQTHPSWNVSSIEYHNLPVFFLNLILAPTQLFDKTNLFRLE